MRYLKSGVAYWMKEQVRSLWQMKSMEVLSNGGKWTHLYPKYGKSV